MGGVRGDVIALAFIYTTIMEMGQPPAVHSDELFHIQCFHGNIIYMEVKLRRIGTSKGVIIPKAFIDELALGEAVEMNLIGGELALKPKRKVREGWAEAAARIGSEPSTRKKSPGWASSIQRISRIGFGNRARATNEAAYGEQTSSRQSAATSANSDRLLSFHPTR